MNTSESVRLDGFAALVLASWVALRFVVISPSRAAHGAA